VPWWRRPLGAGDRRGERWRVREVHLGFPDAYAEKPTNLFTRRSDSDRGVCVAVAVRFCSLFARGVVCPAGLIMLRR